MSKSRGKRGSGESREALRDAAHGKWENISTRKHSKSNFAVTGGEGRPECAPTEEVLDLHVKHNRAVEAFRGKARVRLISE